MQIRTAIFSGSAAHPRQFLKRPIPHFVFAGRSNVGKSSLLNKLLNRKNLAKTSGSPGKTRLVNYFLVNDRFFFVDIPGYGYAKVSKKERLQWGRLVETYFERTPYIAMVFQLLDIRRNPNDDDLQMIEWLQYHTLPFSILLTKSDKLSKNQALKRQSEIAARLGVARTEILPTSAAAGAGVKETWGLINHVYESVKSPMSAKETP